MNAQWVKSAAARRVIEHWADTRPAWLWSGDGERLLWRNDSARLFRGRIKKSGLKLGPEPSPIKGQVARLIRLGSLGRPSLSRVQFLAGDRAISATCACTPLELDDQAIGLLIVAVDPIEADLLELRDLIEGEAGSAGLLPPQSQYLLLDEDGHVAAGSTEALRTLAPALTGDGFGGFDGERLEVEGGTFAVERFPASPLGATLMLFTPPVETTRVEQVRAEEGLDALERREPDTGTGAEAESTDEPLLPMGLAPLPPKPAVTEPGPEDLPTSSETLSLSSLFDRLADDPALFAPLPSAADTSDTPPAPRAEPAADQAEAAPEPLPAPQAVTTAEPAVIAPGPELVPESVGVATMPEPEADDIANIIAFADDPESGPAEPESRQEPAEADRGADGDPSHGETMDAPGLTTPPPDQNAHSGEPETPDAPADADVAEPEHETAPLLYRVIGRGFTPLATPQPAPVGAVAAMPETSAAEDSKPIDPETRHNFDELSRILADRVGAPQPASDVTSDEVPRPVPTQPVPEGALISLNGETFILNRLPLGIMVLRDQQVLFSNRALNEMVGHESIDSLRSAGLSAIFPPDGADGPGPVSHVIHRDGTPLPVNARLQSITWQGRPALMLSASPLEPRFGHEAAVRSFAELSAETRGEGFVAADRAGIIVKLNEAGHARLGVGAEAIGKPLAALLDEAGRAALKFFLDRPARFAETVRPSVVLKAADTGAELALFAEGQAGIVSGYFGFVDGPARPDTVTEPDFDPSMLGRISRGVRRPLNTIIGFADLIRSSAFGAIENQRYLDYARDIRSAGQEIAMLVDELDDFTRLKDGRYPVRPSDVDVGTLLDSCVQRIKAQAGAARVLVRSAISERLPRIRADRASLGQAVLNLLASAIDQTPVGGSVILSAQLEDDGAIAINVRDSSATAIDPGDRFVVFRDGTGRDGEALTPVRSSVGLALTRSLLAVNSATLAVAPTPGTGTLFLIVVPADLVMTDPA